MIAQDQIKLLPCPFCGTPPKLETCGQGIYSIIECKECFQAEVICGTDDDAITDWNTRATTGQSTQSEANEVLDAQEQIKLLRDKIRQIADEADAHIDYPTDECDVIANSMLESFSRKLNEVLDATAQPEASASLDAVPYCRLCYWYGTAGRESYCSGVCIGDNLFQATKSVYLISDAAIALQSAKGGTR